MGRRRDECAVGRNECDRRLYAHGGDGGETFAKTAKAPPLQSALRGFIAPNHADHPCVPHRGIPHATASGKGGMPNHNVINAHAFIATRYDKCATRHATSLLRRWAIHTLR